MADERNPLDAQVGEVESAAQKLVQALEAATRDVAASAEFAVRNIHVPAYGGTRATAGEIDQETAAIARRNAAEADSLALDEARLRLLAQQNAEMAAAASRGIVTGAAPYRAGGGGANVAREFEAQQAAAQAEMQSIARRQSITSGVPPAYSQRSGGDTAAARVAEAEAQINAQLEAEQANVARLIELYGERAAAARASVRAELDANAAEVEAAAATRQRVTSWAMSTGSNPAVVRSTLEDLARGGFGPGTGEPSRSTLLPIHQVTPGPSAATEFEAWTNQMGAQRNVASATDGLERMGRVQAEASQAMRAHGALTTEFLSALGRGEVTLSEFGYQVGATAGKFAGWTAAAAGVFGVIGLFKDLTTGAKDAQNEAANLSRFIPNLDKSRAQQGFVDVSQQLNVPIKDVGESQSQFAKIFHDQASSLQAARTSLLATKLDNVSTADSYKYFTAIIQEWKLQANDLPGLFDQISAAQRRMGARVSEVLPAFARSSSAVRATATPQSDPAQMRNELIALIATAQTATGRTGPEIGTAFARAAANFYRNPKDVQVEEQFGLDPRHQDFTTFLRAAIQRSATLDGGQRLALARAIGGPLRGGTIFAPLLGQEQRLQQAEQWTAPTRAAGSSMQELGDKLTGVHEVIGQITHGIERLGAELGRSGAFSGFGVALEGVNALLLSVTKLVELFNMLPASVRPWVALLVEARAAMLVTQNTRFGGAVASATRLDRLPGFGRSADAVARDEFMTGARQTFQMQSNMFESTANQAAVTRARQIAAEQVAAENRALAAETDNQAEKDALLQRANVMSARAAELNAEAVQLEQTALAYQEQRNATKAAMNDLKRGELTLDEAAVAMTPGVGGTRSAAEGATAAEGAAATAAAAQAARSGASRAGVALEGSMTGAEAEMAAAQTVGLGAFMRVESAASGIAGAAVGLGTRLKGAIGAFINPFTVLVTSAILGYSMVEQAISQAQQQSTELASLNTTPSNYAQFTRQTTQAARNADGRPAGGVLGAFQTLGSAATLGAYDPSSPSAFNSANDAAWKANNAQIVAWGRERAAGKPAMNTYLDMVQKQWETDLGRDQDYAKLRRDLENRIVEAQHSIEAQHGDSKKVNQLIQAMRDRATGRDPVLQFSSLADFMGVSSTGVSADAQRMQDMASARRAGGGNMGAVISRATAGYLYAAQQWSGSSRAVDLKAFNEIQSRFTQTIQTSAEGDLQENLALARTPAERQAVYARVIGRYQAAEQQIRQTLAQSGVGGRVATAAHNLLRQIQALAQPQVDAAFQAREQDRQVELAYQQSTTEDKHQQIIDGINVAGQAVNDALRTYGRNSTQYLVAIKDQNQAHQQLTDYNRQLIQTQAAYQASTIMTQGTAGDIARQRANLEGLRNTLAYDKSHGADRNTIVQDMTAINNAVYQISQTYQQQAQDAQALWDAAYTAAHVGDQGNPVQAAIDQLHQDAHDMRYMKTPQARGQQRAKVAQDRYNVGQQIIQEDINRADFEHQIGQLSDSAYIAQLQQILRMKQVSTQTRRQLLEQIYQLNQSAGQNLELNVGSIKLPTLYDVRRAAAAGAASHGASFGAGNVVVQHSPQMTFQINVAKPGDASTVYKAIEDATNTSLQGTLRAAGVT